MDLHTLTDRGLTDFIHFFIETIASEILGIMGQNFWWF
jgi:hypothetical protein